MSSEGSQTGGRPPAAGANRTHAHPGVRGRRVRLGFRFPELPEPALVGFQRRGRFVAPQNLHGGADALARKAAHRPPQRVHYAHCRFPAVGRVQQRAAKGEEALRAEEKAPLFTVAHTACSESEAVQMQRGLNCGGAFSHGTFVVGEYTVRGGDALLPGSSCRQLAARRRTLARPGVRRVSNSRSRDGLLSSHDVITCDTSFFLADTEHHIAGTLQRGLPRAVARGFKCGCGE